MPIRTYSPVLSATGLDRVQASGALVALPVDRPRQGRIGGRCLAQRLPLECLVRVLGFEASALQDARQGFRFRRDRAQEGDRFHCNNPLLTQESRACARLSIRVAVRISAYLAGQALSPGILPGRRKKASKGPMTLIASSLGPVNFRRPNIMAFIGPYSPAPISSQRSVVACMV
jgi:hypothetical protein